MLTPRPQSSPPTQRAIPNSGPRDPLPLRRIPRPIIGDHRRMGLGVGGATIVAAVPSQLRVPASRFRSSSRMTCHPGFPIPVPELDFPRRNRKLLGWQNLGPIPCRTESHENASLSLAAVVTLAVDIHSRAPSALGPSSNRRARPDKTRGREIHARPRDRGSDRSSRARTTPCSPTAPSATSLPTFLSLTLKPITGAQGLGRCFWQPNPNPNPPPPHPRMSRPELAAPKAIAFSDPGETARIFRCVMQGLLSVVPARSGQCLPVGSRAGPPRARSPSFSVPAPQPRFSGGRGAFLAPVTYLVPASQPVALM
ncbi:hypothetical protein PUNSTDRAFT_128792 [Punctularia strigosozonata HHB-11173 SS5]|uniref:uncharacterized protein n=1 Tax=Punctularia strigosozonata (strain HHB-11173) TaxID=741275 RepID=UPI0004417DD7|nr:uncharacterized protein PUNSTDRAFT_128792 [Punctularia strigosozonata HHB-11173 SS5]EIN13110.1 hypothetical protein PUNSTDRAFT_128792 [Punctularia strigosozonata HHB-11173 SS5]